MHNAIPNGKKKRRRMERGEREEKEREIIIRNNEKNLGTHASSGGM
jgi:hypothetical protein